MRQEYLRLTRNKRAKPELFRPKMAYRSNLKSVQADYSGGDSVPVSDNGE